MSKAKVGIDAGKISEKWGRRMSGAVTDIQNGIAAVTTSPMEEAIKKQDKMLNGIQNAITSGRWAAGLRGVSLAEWKDKTSKLTAARLASGVQEAMPKRQKFDQYLVQTLNAGLPAIAAMPDLTLEDSVNRVRAMMTHMANNPYKK